MEPVFYDCEASGLEGVPIEIGWATSDPQSGQILSEGHLIKPPADWLIDHVWDPEAEKLHGITRAKLQRDGKPVWKIAQRMNDVLASRELFADAPSDEAWLGQLFHAAGLSSLTIRRMDAPALIAKRAAERGFNANALAQIDAESDKIAPRLHRAEADAKNLRCDGASSKADKYR